MSRSCWDFACENECIFTPLRFVGNFSIKPPSLWPLPRSYFHLLRWLSPVQLREMQVEIQRPKKWRFPSRPAAAVTDPRASPAAPSAFAHLTGDGRASAVPGSRGILRPPLSFHCSFWRWGAAAIRLAETRSFRAAEGRAECLVFIAAS